jgi:hypothetical protein
MEEFTDAFHNGKEEKAHFTATKSKDGWLFRRYSQVSYLTRAWKAISNNAEATDSSPKIF